MSSSATASPLPNPPVIKHFTIVMTRQLNVVVADGSNPGGIGQITSTTPTSLKMTFPAGPGTVTLTPTLTGITPADARCSTTSQQNGTFSFTFAPTAQPGFAFGGSGGYVEFTTVTYQRHGRRCATSRVKSSLTVIEAGATELHGTG